MKRIDWNRFSPLGVPGKQLWNGLCLALGGATGVSAGIFFLRYADAYESLFHYTQDREWQLKPGAVMTPFAVLMDGALTGLWILAGCMLLVILALYLVHYQEGRRIYTMLRLPKRWELWRRCITLPVWMAVLCAVTAGVLTLLCYGFYFWITPNVCLPR